jgi:hypothetical protein
MNSRGSRWAAIFVVGVAATALRCADRDVSQIIGTNLPAPGDAGADPTRCVPGQTLACMGACSGGISAGYQVCAEDGRSYGQCVCPPGGGGERPFISIAPGTVLLSPEGGPRIRLPDPRPIGEEPVEPGLVGAPCAADADCEGSLSCLTSSSTLIAGGGVAGGYCTADCTSNADCTRIDPISACYALGGQNMCVRLCLSQTPGENEPKCLFRPDLTCVSEAILNNTPPTGERQVGICAPQCQSDASCGGRTCDLARGLCMDTPRPGAPIGGACEVAADCGSGVCLGLTEETERACSAFCTLGAPGCGFQSGETPGAACMLAQVPGEGVGDRGLCIEVCDTSADCLEPGSECAPTAASPRAGICARFPSSPPIDPPDAGPPNNEPPDDEPPDDEPDGGSREPEPTSTVGLACESDSDCGGGVCLTSDSNPLGTEGGPAGGYCSTSCSLTTSCDPGAICLRLSPESGVCLLRCSPDDENACHGRDTLECNVTRGPQNGFCQPRCNSDADCGDRVCDPGPQGLCMDPCTSDADCEDGTCNESTRLCEPPCTLDADCGDERICDLITRTCAPPPVVPAGGACESNEDCPGDVCLPTATAGFCSALCAPGTEIGCEVYGTDSFCLLESPQLPPEVGLCADLCNVPADCATPGFRCLPIGGNVNGNTGLCLP